MTKTSFVGHFRREAWWILLCSVLLASAMYIWSNSRTRPSQSVQTINFASGARIPATTLSDISGLPQPLIPAGDSRPQVIYVFSPFCSWCKKNEENLQALRGCLGRDVGFQAVSLGPDGLDHYFSSRLPDYRLLIDKEHMTGVVATPTTILVAGDGTVERVWEGAYAGPTALEIGNEFNCVLPGLKPTGNSGLID